MSDFRLASAADLGPQTLLRVAETPVGGIVLVRWEGSVHALSDRCPHAAALLSEGFLEAGRLVCPLHFAAFDLRTGEGDDAPPGCRPARVFAVYEREGDLFLVTPAAAPA